MKGVLLTAYGSPSGPDDVERYYTRILGGRKPPSPLLEELMGRYAAIGGVSPLEEITMRQAAGLKRALEARGNATEVRVGMKYSPPFIEDAVASMISDGFSRILVLPLTPFNSSVSADSYLKIARKAASGAGAAVEMPSPWHLNSNFVRCWEEILEESLTGGEKVIFTAHSIPGKYIEAGEPYREQIAELADCLAGRMGIADSELAFQSAGRTGEGWIGPPLEERLAAIDAGETKNILIAPIGFVSEHLEVLYDVDIEAVRIASGRGISLRRTALPNDREAFISALADACALRD